jgi:hypothetical protein
LSPTTTSGRSRSPGYASHLRPCSPQIECRREPATGACRFQDFIKAISSRSVRAGHEHIFFSRYDRFAAGETASAGSSRTATDRAFSVSGMFPPR